MHEINGAGETSGCDVRRGPPVKAVMHGRKTKDRSSGRRCCWRDMIVDSLVAGLSQRGIQGREEIAPPPAIVHCPSCGPSSVSA
jgi:hypothetical protein